MKDSVIPSKALKFAMAVVQGIPIPLAFEQAGYSVKGANSNAYNLLKKPKIAALIKEEQDKLRESTSFITKEYISSKLRELDKTTTSDGIKIKIYQELSKLLGLTDSSITLKTENNQPLFVLLPPDKDKNSE